MAIDTRSIDSDLTLELDEEEITVAEFKNALNHFLGLVKEVTRQVTPRQQKWLVRVYPGSAGVGLYTKPGTFLESERATIRQSVVDGLDQLEHGERPKHYTDRAVEHARSIRTAFERKNRVVTIRIWNRNESSRAVSEEIVERAKHLLDAVYEDDGSVEGTLEILSGHGGLSVCIFDPLDARRIKCDISEDDLKTALAAFQQRVEIFGKVHYRRDGMPVSVKVERIVPFPPPEDIPALEEIRGILRTE